MCRGALADAWLPQGVYHDIAASPMHMGEDTSGQLDIALDCAGGDLHSTDEAFVPTRRGAEPEFSRSLGWQTAPSDQLPNTCLDFGAVHNGLSGAVTIGNILLRHNTNS